MSYRLGRDDRYERVCNRVVNAILTAFDKEGLNVTIHMYRSFSTSSTYLKLDYGVAGSIRLADHNGKKHLKYRFNLLLSDESNTVTRTMQDGTERSFYGYGAFDIMLTDLIEFKKSRMTKYGKPYGYNKAVEKAKRESHSRKGFWRAAWEINWETNKILNTNLTLQKESSSLETKREVVAYLAKEKIELSQMDGIVQYVRSVDAKMDKLLTDSGCSWHDLNHYVIESIIKTYRKHIDSEFTEIPGLFEVEIG